MMADGGEPAAIGSWVVYGLGTENQNLPVDIVLDDPKGLPINGNFSVWQSAWLPPIYQGTRFRTEGLLALNLQPEEIPTPLVEAERALLRKLDAARICRRGRTSRSWRRGFRAMSWRRGCRWRLPMRWT
jgi:hypothetical protein